MLYVNNTYYEYKSLHKYTRVARGQGGVEVKNIIDLVLVRKGFLQHVRSVRGRGCSLSDHHVMCKVRLVGAER